MINLRGEAQNILCQYRSDSTIDEKCQIVLNGRPTDLQLKMKGNRLQIRDMFSKRLFFSGNGVESFAEFLEKFWCMKKEN